MNASILRPVEQAVDPPQRREWALFLDVDGTLLRVAIGPGAVVVPARTRLALRTALAREAGAVALVSGRTVADLDRLFAPLQLPTIGVHGLEWRDAAGRFHAAQIPSRHLDAARRRVVPLVAAHAGLELEDKGCSLAVHFRLAPHLEQQVRQLLDQQARALPDYRVQEGKYCLDLRPALRTKGPAIDAFMRMAPFAGRQPVFVGDDATDEQGFETVNALGGLSIHVGNRVGSAARWQFPNVNAVVRWLMAPQQAVVRALRG